MLSRSKLLEVIYRRVIYCNLFLCSRYTIFIVEIKIILFLGNKIYIILKIIAIFFYLFPYNEYISLFPLNLIFSPLCRCPIRLLLYIVPFTFVANVFPSEYIFLYVSANAFSEFREIIIFLKTI